MYIPKSFREDDPDVLFDLIELHNFGILFSMAGDEPIATHLPFMVDRPSGMLVAHMARANPHWKTLEGAAAMVVFQGPHDYISPSWYASDGNVPTWNYAAVHVYGRPQLVHDLGEIGAMVTELMEYHEAAMPCPAAVPDSYLTDSKLGAVIGLRMPITRMEGKFKFNQNKSLDDQQSVIAKLDQRNDPDSVAMAAIMRRNLERAGQ